MTEMKRPWGSKQFWVEKLFQFCPKNVFNLSARNTPETARNQAEQVIKVHTIILKVKKYINVNGTKPKKVFHTYSISYMNHAMMLIIPSSANLGASSVMGSLQRLIHPKKMFLTGLSTDKPKLTSMILRQAARHHVQGSPIYQPLYRNISTQCWYNIMFQTGML